MSTFGSELDGFGLFGTSIYNPRELTNNCVFVTIAYLLGMNADQLAAKIEHEREHEANKGVSLEELYQMLEYHGITGSGYVMRLTVQRIHGCFDGSANVCGIAYQRPNGTAHCATVRQIARDKLHPHGLQFVCYQKSTDGLDVTEDSQQSRNTMLFKLTQNGFVYFGRRAGLQRLGTMTQSMYE
ncbi:hypothetical protein EG329_012060 [Mollisiaceae sp. DMI_Dod_QoI]|nr:hypothetical protein EG329_012060 [Helotiales sp. DMI_Dod_QoI]